MVGAAEPGRIVALRRISARPDCTDGSTSSRSIFIRWTAGAYHYGNADAEQRNLAYLHAVVREAAAPGKPVVLAEFGWYGGGKPTLDRGTWPAAIGGRPGAVVPARGRDDARSGFRMAQLGTL